MWRKRTYHKEKHRSFGRLEIRLEVNADTIITWSCIEIRMQEEFVYNKDSIIVPLKCGTVQYLGSKLINQNSIQEEIRSRLKDRECLLSFGEEFFVFQFAI
jgi:hypothetical protein